jgi:hypothetical protein
MDVGDEIGDFYHWLQVEYPDSSTIFAGIIPTNPIGTGNTTDLNNQIQSKIGGTSGTNRFYNTNDTTQISDIINAVNLHLSNMSTSSLTMSKQPKAKQPWAVENQYMQLAGKHTHDANRSAGVTVTKFAV